VDTDSDADTEYASEDHRKKTGSQKKAGFQKKTGQKASISSKRRRKDSDEDDDEEDTLPVVEVAEQKGKQGSTKAMNVSNKKTKTDIGNVSNKKMKTDIGTEKREEVASTSKVVTVDNERGVVGMKRKSIHGEDRSDSKKQKMSYSSGSPDEWLAVISRAGAVWNDFAKQEHVIPVLKQSLALAVTQFLALHPQFRA
jgi:hypothetical protein